VTLPPEPAGFRGPWCTMCGYVATFYLATLDPAHPIAYCRRGEDLRETTAHTQKGGNGPVIPYGARGKPAGCGRVIGSYDAAEANTAYCTRRRKLTEARHRQHDPQRPEKWANWCRPCDTVQAARSHIGTDAGRTLRPGAARKG